MLEHWFSNLNEKKKRLGKQQQTCFPTQKMNKLIFSKNKHTHFLLYTNIPHSNESRKKNVISILSILVVVVSHSQTHWCMSWSRVFISATQIPNRTHCFHRWCHCISFKNMWLLASLWNWHFIGRVFRVTAKALLLQSIEAPPELSFFFFYFFI